MFNKKNCIDIYGDAGIDKYDLFSVVIRQEDKYSTVSNFISSFKDNPKWIIFMLHGIQSKSEETYGKDSWCWDVDNFENLCKSLRNMIDNEEIYVKPILDVIVEKV